MKNKRFLYLAVVFVILILLVYIKKNKKNSIKPDYFAISDTASVNSFILFDDLDTLYFSKLNDWVINSRWKAKTSYVREFLKIMKRVEIKAPIKGEAGRRYIDSIKKYGVHVIINQDEKQAKSFMFYENYLNGEINSFMLDRENTGLFLVKIPAYYGKLHKNFSLNIGDWKDNTLLQFKPFEIESVKVNYTLKPENSYVVEKDSLNIYNLYNMGGDKLYCIPPNIEKYFTYFQNVEYISPVEINELKNQQGIMQYAKLDVSLKQGKSYGYAFYKIPEKADNKGNEYDLNVALVHDLSDNQHYIVKYVEVDLLLKDIQYFK